MSTLEEEIQQSISKYYLLSEKIQDREDISNEFIKDEYQPYIFKGYGALWNRGNGSSLMQRVYHNDPREIPPIDVGKLLEDKTLEVLIFTRHYQTTIQKQFYVLGIEELEEIIQLIEAHEK